MVAVELDRFSVSVVAVLLDVLVLIESRSLAVLVLLSLVVLSLVVLLLVLLLVAVLIEVMPVEDQMRDELELVKPKSEELVDCESSK